MSRASSERNQRGPRSKRQTQQYTFTSYEDAQELLNMIIGMALSGGAIRVGLTRDGGALAIGVYQGEEYGTEYVTPHQDLLMELRQIEAGWGIPPAVWDDDADCWRIA